MRIAALLCMVTCWVQTAMAQLPATGYPGGAPTRAFEATFRHRELTQAAACAAALRTSPRDPALMVAKADALLRSQHPRAALGVYRNALRSGAPPAVVKPKIAAAKAVLRRAQRHARPVQKKRLPVAPQPVLLGEAGAAGRRASNEAQTTRSN